MLPLAFLLQQSVHLYPIVVSIILISSNSIRLKDEEGGKIQKSGTTFTSGIKRLREGCTLHCFCRIFSYRSCSHSCISSLKIGGNGTVLMFVVVGVS